MKADEYLRECLVKRLLPFLKSKYQLSDVFFWPDMASIHYEKNVINWLKLKGIQFVKKADNTPNCPQVRPIEKFWSFCKREYSSTDAISKTPEDLRKYGLKWAEKSVEDMESSVGKFQQKNFFDWNFTEISLQLIKSSKLIIIKIKHYEFVNQFYLRSI